MDSAKRNTAAVCVVVSLILCAHAASNQSHRGGPPLIWDGEAGDGQFFNALNWDPDSLPGPNDEALINMGGPVTATGLPIEVSRLTVETGLNLVSSAVAVQVLSSINNLTTGGCCATTIDSGQEKLIIKGTSTFDGQTLFLGNNTELQDLSTHDDGFTVRTGASLTIAGTSVLGISANAIETGGQVEILGSLELKRATLFSVSNQDADWLVTAGEIAHTGPGTSGILDKVTVNSGMLRADTGTLDIRKDIDLNNAQLQVSNGGTIHILPDVGSQTLNINATSITGTGRVEIDGLGFSIQPEGELCTVSVTGDGFWLDAGVDLGNTELLNTGVFSMRGLVEADKGRVRVQSGTMSIDEVSTFKCPLIINTAGTLRNPTAFTVSDELRIDQGALFEMHADLDAGPGADLSPPNPLVLNGLLALPAGVTNQIEIKDHNLNLGATGVVQLTDRRLAAERGGTLSAGRIILQDTPAGANTEFTFSGDTNSEFTLANGLEIIGSGDHATCFIGNGFGPQPSVHINNELILNISGEHSAARIRVPTITSPASSFIRNTGNLILERSVSVAPIFQNTGSLEIGATTTLNDNDNFGTDVNEGSITQSAILKVQEGRQMLNTGTWTITASSKIENIDGPDPERAGIAQEGLFRALSGTSSIEVPFFNRGTVLANNATLNFTRASVIDHDGRRYITGHWQTVNNGKINFPENPPTVITGEDTLLESNKNDMPVLCDIESIEDGASIKTNDLQRDGDLSLDTGNLEVTESGTANIDGQLNLKGESTATVNQGATLNANQEISVGTDTPDAPSVLDDLQGTIALALGDVTPPSIIAPIINIHANLTPILDDTGTMNTAGQLTIHPTGTLRINAAADGLASSINHTGDLDILGNISITPLKGYQPQLGDSYTIATASGSIAALPARATGTAPSNLTYHISQNAGTITATVVCRADLNADLDIDFFDVSAFLTAFNAQDPLADFNNDALFNFFDVSAFLTAYNASCP